MMSSRNSLLLASGLAAAFLVSSCGGEPPSGDPEDYPEQDIEIIVGFGPGGGTDVFARQIARQIEEKTGVNIQINNMDGAGGANAIQAAQGRSTDGYTWLADASLGIIAGRDEMDGGPLGALQPVAQFEDEIFQLFTLPENFESWDEFVEASEEDTMRIGGTGAGGAADLVVHELILESGLDWEYIPFDGTGELYTALQSDNIDAALGTYGHRPDEIEAGVFHSLLIMHDEELDEFEGIPTSVGEGIDVTTGNTRGIMVHPDVDDEIAAEIEELLYEVHESQEYQDHLASLYIDSRSGWLDSEDYREFTLEYAELSHEVFSEAR
jgi:putative tricarboxylic transport membrane protein